MEFKEYQAKAHETAITPKIGEMFVYPTLGLAGEAGEIANKIKKIFRDKKGVVAKEEEEELKKELGDVLWYVAELATQLNLSLEEIAALNIERLHSRKVRDMIQGDGDNR